MDAEVSVDISWDDPRWEAIGLGELAHNACRAAINEVSLAGEFDVSLLATSDAAIRSLNAKFREKDSATNVLSWPTEELSPDNPGDTPFLPEDHEIGDIALAYETCVAEATSAGIEVHDHVTHLVLHGCLHLLGYDHETEEDATLMETIEIAALAKLGIKNPYL